MTVLEMVDAGAIGHQVHRAFVGLVYIKENESLALLVSSFAVRADLGFKKAFSDGLDFFRLLVLLLLDGNHVDCGYRWPFDSDVGTVTASGLSLIGFSR